MSYDTTYCPNLTSTAMSVFSQVLNDIQCLSPCLHTRITPTEKEDLQWSVHYKRGLMIQGGPRKRNLQTASETPSVSYLTVTNPYTEMCWNFFEMVLLTSLTRATCSPSHRNIVVWSHSSPDLLQCDKKLPCTGMMHGLKYDKNLSDSSPCISLYWTAWEPSAASNSTALSEAIMQCS